MALLLHTERVTVQAANPRGIVKPGSEPVEAVARLVTGLELETIRQRVVSKYWLITKFSKFMGQLIGRLKGKPFPYGDRGVIVKL